MAKYHPRLKISSTPPEFRGVFERLREILREHSSRFIVSGDGPDFYCLQVRSSPRFKKSFPIAWVKISSSYVSFHFMPIYFAPDLQQGLSPVLKKRMQGKSCFNFRTIDEDLFTELRELTSRGFSLSRKMRVV